jgi:hypothetical protein
MGLMALGTLLDVPEGLPTPATAHMGSDPVALLKDFYRGLRGADSTTCRTKV